MREALRLQSSRAGRLRSRLISICTSKAPRARSLSPLRASLATCLQGATMERLRYRTDRGYADAARLIADFQADVAARVEAGHLDGQMLTYVAGAALHQ